MLTLSTGSFCLQVGSTVEVCPLKYKQHWYIIKKVNSQNYKVYFKSTLVFFVYFIYLLDRKVSLYFV